MNLKGYIKTYKMKFTLKTYENKWNNNRIKYDIIDILKANILNDLWETMDILE